MDKRIRNRTAYFVALLFVIAAGLLSRSDLFFLPQFFKEYGGDTLWALMVFIIFGFILPELKTLWIALLGASFSLGIELSQLYHAPWIDAIRRNPLGGVILGYGFLYSDLICYFFGILIGFLFERIIWKGGLSFIPLFTDQSREETINGMDG